MSPVAWIANCLIAPNNLWSPEPDYATQTPLF